MTNIVQLDFDDLQVALKLCFKEAIHEIKEIPLKPELLDRIGLKEAIEITGLKESALYKMTMKDSIPHKKFQKRLVFSRKELEAWVAERTVRKQSPEEIASQQLAKVARKKLNKY